MISVRMDEYQQCNMMSIWFDATRTFLQGETVVKMKS